MCSNIEPGHRPKQNIQNEAGPMETDNARSTIYTRSNSRIIASVPNPECSSAHLESSLQSPILCLFRSRRSVLQLFILSGLNLMEPFLIRNVEFGAWASRHAHLTTSHLQHAQTCLSIQSVCSVKMQLSSQLWLDPIMLFAHTPNVRNQHPLSTRSTNDNLVWLIRYIK